MLDDYRVAHGIQYPGLALSFTSLMNADAYNKFTWAYEVFHIGYTTLTRGNLFRVRLYQPEEHSLGSR